MSNKKQKLKPKKSSRVSREQVDDLLRVVREVDKQKTKQKERMNAMNTNATQSSRQIVRGEIYYIMPYGETATDSISDGGRPGIVISNDMDNTLNGVIEVVYLTRHPWHDSPTNVVIKATGQTSVALCNQVSSVNKRRIGKYVGQVSDYELSNLEKAVAIGIGLHLNRLQTKDIADVLIAWKNSIVSNPCMFELDDTEPCMDERLSGMSACEVTTDIVKKEVQDRDVIITDSKSDSLESVSFEKDITNHPDYLKLKAERDMLQTMYDNLLKKCIG